MAADFDFPIGTLLGLSPFPEWSQNMAVLIIDFIDFSWPWRFMPFTHNFSVFIFLYCRWFVSFELTYFVYLNPFLVLVCLPKWTWKLNHAQNVFLADSYRAILWHSKLQVADAEARNDETRRFQLDRWTGDVFGTHEAQQLFHEDHLILTPKHPSPNSAKIAACITYRPWENGKCQAGQAANASPGVTHWHSRCHFLGCHHKRQTSFWPIRAKPC